MDKTYLTDEQVYAHKGQVINCTLTGFEISFVRSLYVPERTNPQSEVLSTRQLDFKTVLDGGGALTDVYRFLCAVNDVVYLEQVSGGKAKIVCIERNMRLCQDAGSYEYYGHDSFTITVY